MLEDYDVYLYNRLNDESATDSFYANFEENIKNEENMFRKSVYNKFLTIRDWNLSKLNFLKADPNPNFTVRDKVNCCNSIVKNLKLNPIQIKKDNFNMFKIHASCIGNKDLYSLYDEN